MKKKNAILIATYFIATVLVMTGCKKQDPPTVSTAAVSDITFNSAKAGGSVMSDGGAEVTARGVAWSKTQMPTTSNQFTSDGSGTGDFTSTLTGLDEGATYYIRAYATNSEGTSYGQETSFTTGVTSLASLTTTDVTAITLTSAATGGNITSDGMLAVTARGVAWGTSTNPTIDGNHTSDGSGTGQFTSNLTGLTQNTTYYVRAYATNSKGTAYGNELSFKSASPGVPTLTTTAVSSLSPTTGISGGNITSDGGAAVTARGIVWNTSPEPTTANNKTTNGQGTGTFSSSLSGLVNGTVYYVRSYATNSSGTAYGNELRIITPVADIEGNIYKTTQIGNQVWMAENLRTTKYNNNTLIPNEPDSLRWMALTTPGYIWYRNSAANKPLGGLYNWFTVATGNLCPQGWHVPTNPEFQSMEVVAGVPVDSVALWGWRGKGIGTKLKATSGFTVNTGTDVIGFSAVGSGYRSWSNSEFRGKNEIAYYWTSTDDAINAKPTVAYYRRLDGTTHYIFKATTDKKSGKSIRCIKNQ
jgi:uncharacterized protein (TIGR02145 family)